MVNLFAATPEADEQLDRVFSALADSTRRRILAQLEQGGEPASVSALAQAHDMSLPGFMKHLAVLEAAGLVRAEKAGRTRLHHLITAPLGEIARRWPVAPAPEEEN